MSLNILLQIFVVFPWFKRVVLKTLMSICQWTCISSRNLKEFWPDGLELPLFTLLCFLYVYFTIFIWFYIQNVEFQAYNSYNSRMCIWRFHQFYIRLLLLKYYSLRILSLGKHTGRWILICLDWDENTDDSNVITINMTRLRRSITYPTHFKGLITLKYKCMCGSL